MIASMCISKKMVGLNGIGIIPTVHGDDIAIKSIGNKTTFLRLRTWLLIFD